MHKEELRKWAIALARMPRRTVAQDALLAELQVFITEWDRRDGFVTIPLNDRKPRGLQVYGPQGELVP